MACSPSSPLVPTDETLTTTELRDLFSTGGPTKEEDDDPVPGDGEGRVDVCEGAWILENAKSGSGGVWRFWRDPDADE